MPQKTEEQIRRENLLLQKTEEQKHYESVKSFLIWGVSVAGALISAVGIVIAVLTFKDRSEMKDSYEKQIDKYAQSIRDIKTEAIQSQKETSEKSEKEIKYLNDISEKQLASIVSETRQSATAQTQKEIADIFKSDKIQAIIEKNAIGEIKEKLPQILVDYTQKSTPIIEGYNLMKAGQPEGIEILKSYFASVSIFERDLAKGYYQKAYESYESFCSNINQDQFLARLRNTQITISPLNKIAGNLYPKNKADIDNVKLLTTVINNPGNQYGLYQIAMATKALSFIADKNFIFFEKDDINNWYKGLKK